MSDDTALSKDIKPGDDFYSYVNGPWLAAHPIPDDKARYGAFTVLSDENMERLRVMLEADPNAEEPVNVSRLRAFYRSGMDQEAIEAAGLGAVRPLLDRIEDFTGPDDLEAYIGFIHGQGRSMLWHAGIEPDDKDSSRYIFRLSQAGLGLPDRDFYLEEGERFDTIRSRYQDFLKEVFTLLGSDEPMREAEAVFAFETELARASSTATQQRDVDAMYNPFRLERLARELPAFNWPRYLEAVGLPQVTEPIVSQPGFLREALERLRTEPLATWRSYFRFHTVRPLMGRLPKVFEELAFDFYGRVLSGAKEQEPRYRRVISVAQSMMPEPMGQLYVERHFDETAKKEIYDLVGHIQEALRERITALDWMGEETKRQALEKLDTFLPLLGYPDEWKDYGGLSTEGSYAENTLAALEFEWRRETGRFDGPVDRREWLMSPAMVNAYYWPSTNGITFPAGILQPPFFDARGDFAANYGAIGVVIGHEIIHGFDDMGSKFDKNGNLRTWWSEEDRKSFEERAQKLKEQYDEYELNGRRINGELTLGENIADLGGMLLAYDALQKKLAETGEREEIDGFSPEQRFFMAYARVWRQHTRPEVMLQLLVADPHSPGEYRVNGVVPNVDAFYEAFDVKPGDELYIPLEERVRIW